MRFLTHLFWLFSQCACLYILLYSSPTTILSCGALCSSSWISFSWPFRNQGSLENACKFKRNLQEKCHRARPVMLDTVRRKTEPRRMAWKADGDLDRRLKIIIKLRQKLMVYTSSNYFLLCTTGTIPFNIYRIHWNNMILPKKCEKMIWNFC